MLKSVEEISPDDFERFPVWEFINDDAVGELMMRPIECVPVNSLNNRIVGTLVSLANGDVFPVLLGNVDVQNIRSTQQFLTMTIFKDGQRFNLARYHDIGYAECGPDALGSFLGIDPDAVFPISYDLRKCCMGDPDALAGSIEKLPPEILTRSELAALALL